MLTKLRLNNFKRFNLIDIELSNPVLFVGPNNSGKTSALQALSLWYSATSKILAAMESNSYSHLGVPLDLVELSDVAIPNVKSLWKNLADWSYGDVKGPGRPKGEHSIRINIEVELAVSNNIFNLNTEFLTSKSGALSCRAENYEEVILESLTTPDGKFLLPPVFYLPPMSGISIREDRLDLGSIKHRIGEGRTAEVLRNLCYNLYKSDNGTALWKEISDNIYNLFGAKLKAPKLLAANNTLQLSFTNEENIEMDISLAGRGLLQALHLLVFMNTNRNSVILIDEPDAHMEIIRQREITDLIIEVSHRNNVQLVIASHSELVLDEFEDKGNIIAFLGDLPYEITSNVSQVRKSLKEIPFHDYYLATQKRWILYLEGSTDLRILHKFAENINHEAKSSLERPFLHEICNNIKKAKDHFYGIKAANNEVKGFALLDHDESIEEHEENGLKVYSWKRNEIENYIFYPSTLLKFAEVHSREYDTSSLFADLYVEQFRDAMNESIDQIYRKIALNDENDDWWIEAKASKELKDVFELYYKKLQIMKRFPKGLYYRLAEYIPKEKVDKEVKYVLDLVHKVSSSTRTKNNKNKP